MSGEPQIDPRRFEVPAAPIWPFAAGGAVVLGMLVVGIVLFAGTGDGEDGLVESRREERVARLAEPAGRQSAVERRAAGEMTGGSGLATGAGSATPTTPAPAEDGPAPEADQPLERQSPDSDPAQQVPPESGTTTPAPAVPPPAADDASRDSSMPDAPASPEGDADAPDRPELPPAAPDPADVAPARSSDAADVGPRRPGPEIAGAIPETDAAELARLIAEAERAFEARDEQALPLLRDVAVRLQGQVQRVSAQGLADEADEAQSQLELVLERIRALDRLAGAPGATGPAVEMDADTRTPHEPPRPGEVRQLSIMELGNFRYDERTGGIPEDIEALSGMEVRVAGFMVPTYQTDRIREFALVPDIFECCFGEPPGLEHVVYVVLPEGRAVTFHHGEVEVTGKLVVEEQKEDGYVVNLFAVSDVTSVRATGR